MKDIPHYEDFVNIIPIEKGWSGDKKYYIETAHDEKLLLRISGISEYDRKKAEFEIMQKVCDTGAPSSVPVDFGVCGEGNSVYSLFTWIEGEDAERILPKLSREEQYNLGIDAGKLLTKLHAIPAPKEQEDWELRFNRKIDTKIRKYEECGIRFPGDSMILGYIEENRVLLAGRPQTFQHGDYHIGNMIVSPEGKIFVIDFNRFDFGDPWEEFNRIVWCAAASPAFAAGRIDGYFGGRPPEEFFRLLALYISSNTLSSIYWAIPFGQGEIDTMMKQAKNVIDWFDGMRDPVPRWYSAV